MRIYWKKVWVIYATVAIPLLYLYNIYLAYAFGNTLKLPFFIIFLGFIFAVIGCIAWIVSYINLGISFGVLPQKQKRVKRGLYKYFNHPMYLGIYVTFLGLSLANLSLPGILFLHLVLVPIFFIRAKIEEKNLIP